MPDLNFTIRTDASSVIEGLQKAENAAEGTGKALGGVSAAAKGAMESIVRSNADFAASWERAAVAIAKQRAEIQKTAEAERALTRERERLAAASAKALAARGKGLNFKLESLISGRGTTDGGALRGAGIGLGLAAAGGAALGRSAWNWAGQADALAKQEARVSIQIGNTREAGHVLDELNKFGKKTGTAPTDLMEKAADLMQGGLGSETAIQAIESAVVAAKGDMAKVSSILDKFTEVSAKGWVDKGTIASIERQGVDIRSALGQALHMSAAELQKAISERKITAEQLAAAFSSATAEGTAVRQSFDAQLDTMDGALKQLSVAWGDMCETMGGEFRDTLTNAIKSLTKWINQSKTLFVAIGQYVEDIFSVFGAKRATEEEKEAHRSAELAEKKAKAAAEAAAAENKAAQARIAAESALTQKLNENIKKYEQLDAAAKKRADEAEFAEKSVSERKDIYAKTNNVDLEKGVESIDQQIQREFGGRLAGIKKLPEYHKLRQDLESEGIKSGEWWEIEDRLANRKDEKAQDLLRRVQEMRPEGVSTLAQMGEYYTQKGQELTAEEQQRLEKLYAAREYALQLEKEEKRLQEIRDEESARAQIIEAQLAGDKERLGILQRQQAIEKAEQSFVSSGFTRREARQLAEKRIADDEAIKAQNDAQKEQNKQLKQKTRQQKSDKLSTPGYLEDQLAKVGGGGFRFRDIDISQYREQAKIQEQTLNQTKDLADTTRKIWNNLANRQNAGYVLS